jgi:hypothetical protein
MRANYRNVVYIKYTSDACQYDTESLDNGRRVNSRNVVYINIPQTPVSMTANHFTTGGQTIETSFIIIYLRRLSV